MMTVCSMAAADTGVPVNPCINTNASNPYIAISLGPVVNANIKCWMSPGIISGALIFFFIFAPLFFVVMMLTCSIQSPAIFLDHKINWGKIEEAE
jgi:hypothetical protein